MKTKLLALLLLIPSICFADHWECINRNGLIPTCNTWRWQIPGGWLVSCDNGDKHIAVTFVPDATHEWKV